MSDGIDASTILEALALLAQRAVEAREAERAALETRAEVFVAAVRAGARLEEIGEAAGMTKAAVSAIVLRTLPRRAGKGGPYRRRRGVAAALERVPDVATHARRARTDTHDSVLRRDRAVVAATDRGLSTAALAQAMGTTAPVVRALLARRRSEATPQSSGALAS